MATEFGLSEADRGFVAEEAAGPYLRALARHWVLVAAVTVVTVFVALVTVVRNGHSYQASASVLVSPLSEADPTFIGTGVVLDTGDPARTVQTAAALIDSPQAASAAAATMGRGWTAPHVQDAVSVTPRGQSNVLAVTASAPTSGEAIKLANAYADAAVGSRAQIVHANVARQIKALSSSAASPGGTTGTNVTPAQELSSLRAVEASGRDPTLSFSQRAQPPAAATGAASWLVLALAVFAGLALGSTAALAIEFFSRTVRDARDVEALLPVPILAGLPKIPRSQRRRGLMPASLPPNALEQIRLLRAQLRRYDKTPVIMVTSPDAGDGKTTVASSLAAVLSEGEQEVILMDLDLRKPGVPSAFLLENPLPQLLDRRPLPDRLISVPGFEHLRILPAPIGDLSSHESIVRRLPTLLAEARSLVDWVVVDTAPMGEVSDPVHIAGLCDAVIVVVRPRHSDRSRLALVRGLLARSEATRVGCVLVGAQIARQSGGYYGYGGGVANGGGRPEIARLRPWASSKES